MKKINVLYALFIFVIFLVLSLIGIFFLDINKEEKIGNIVNQHVKTLETYYKILSHNQELIANITFDETIDNKELMQILYEAKIAKNNNNSSRLNQLRNQAITILTPKYNSLRKQGVLQYHFVFPDNAVFLRMHKLDKYGDNLSAARPDFNVANKTLKTVRGFAQGKTAHGFRHVFPLINQNQIHLGAVEISFSSELLQTYFTDINNMHTHFLVRKDIFESHAWKRDDLIVQYVQSAEDNDYMLAMTSKHTKKKCILENGQKLVSIKNQINEKMKQQHPFGVYTIYNNMARIVSFYPIKHALTQEVVAWIVSYEQDKPINDVIESTNIAQFFIVLFLLLLSVFFYFLLTQRFLLSQLVNDKTQNLLVLNKELEGRENELKLLNENLEQIVKQEVMKNKEKDKILFEQTKMAALGEMIGNIAHQWRQPLSVISTIASGMKLRKEYNQLDGYDILPDMQVIMEQSTYLSKTIDDFRDFIKGDNKKELFSLKECIDSFLKIMEPSIKTHYITIDTHIDNELQINSLRNELNQCLINLFNNAKDILKEIDGERIIIISAAKHNSNVIILFQDNGLGIPENIIDKIFEPYFTTKHQSQGTGLGLHMTYKMIHEAINGTISAVNKEFEFGGKRYKGACFEIIIPL